MSLLFSFISIAFLSGKITDFLKSTINKSNEGELFPNYPVLSE